MTHIENFKASSFTSWTLKHLVIDENESGLVVSVPTQTGSWYNVQCDESGLVPTPTSCSCGKHECQHQSVVRCFYARIYKSNVAKQVGITASQVEEIIEVATPAASIIEAPAAEQFDGSRKITAAEWKEIKKADRKRQQAWQNEYRAKVKEAAAIDARGYKSALAS